MSGSRMAKFFHSIALAFDPYVAELYRVCGWRQAQAMLEPLAELAKLGYSAEQLGMIAHAAEHGEILAFEYGRIRRIGKSRTLQQINEDGS